jgi:hypothetical protein
MGPFAAYMRIIWALAWVARTRLGIVEAKEDGHVLRWLAASMVQHALLE